MRLDNLTKLYSDTVILKGAGSSFTPVRLILELSQNLSFFLILELEALEACYWLRAAGFPQYAQMYEGRCI